MNTIAQNLIAIRNELPQRVMLVAVSKNHPAEAVLEAYRAGQRVFGENRVQELVAKKEALPDDIQWHLIGHLQTNKVKYIAPFITLIESVDSLKLLNEISVQGVKYNRVIDCLLQVFIAVEETKFGLDEAEMKELLEEVTRNPMPGVRIRGLMGMATFTGDTDQIRREFSGLKTLFHRIKDLYFREEEYFDQLSCGMSGDYLIAVGEGSTMVRIGTKIFGSR
jgi:PLP dependent protein